MSDPLSGKRVLILGLARFLAGAEAEAVVSDLREAGAMADPARRSWDSNE